LNHTSHHANSFNALRLLAAWLVLVGHSFELLLQRDPIQRIFKIDSLGGVGVVMFFAISGYLVTQSRLRTQSGGAFLWKRALRIFPALWLLIAISVFIAGPLLSRYSLADYFASPTTYSYLRSSLLQFHKYLPGVFENNPLQSGFNGSLWTLPIEAKCYLVLAVFGFARNRWLKPALVLAALAIVALVISHTYRGVFRVAYFSADSYSVGKLVGAFVFGAIIAAWQLERILSPRWVVAASAVVFVACAVGGSEGMSAGWFSFAITIASLTLCIGLRYWKWLAPITPRSDYSYGLYLYAFPVQQALIAYFPQIDPLLHIFFATLIALSFAMMSWHSVEARYLAIKSTPLFRIAWRSNSTRAISFAFAALVSFTLLYDAWRAFDRRVLKTPPANDPVAAEAFLDTPLHAFRAGEPVNIVGWVWHPAGVGGARLFANDEPVSSVLMAYPRPDVAAVFPDRIGIRHSGFGVQLAAKDTKLFAPQTVLSLRIDLHNGRQTQRTIGTTP
jgi:peptidoglycan/LPS O-acetylase OafA/YrhL